VAALHYSTSAVPLIFRFEARGRSRGVEIGFLSLYPKEKEFLYSSLTGLILLNLSQKEEHQLLEMHESQSRQGHGNTPQTSTRQSVLQDELQKIQDEIAQLDAAQSAAEGVRSFVFFWCPTTLFVVNSCFFSGACAGLEEWGVRGSVARCYG